MGLFDKILGGVGAGVSAVSSIIGAVKARKARQQAIDTLTNTHQDNQRWYAGEIAKDYTQGADVQAIMSKQRDLLAEKYKQARARAVVGGASPESIAVQAQANNESIADTMAQVAGQGEQRRATLNQQKIAENQEFSNKMAELQGGQATAIGQAASSLASIGGQMASMGDWSWLTKKKGNAGSQTSAV